MSLSSQRDASLELAVNPPARPTTLHWGAAAVASGIAILLLYVKRNGISEIMAMRAW